MTALRGLAALVPILAGGFAAARLVPFLRRRPVPVQVAWGWLLGVAGCGGALWALSLATGRPPSGRDLLLVGAAPVLVACLSRRPRAEPPARARMRGPLAAAAGVAIGLVSLASLGESLTNPIHDWDGRMTWGAHARHLAAEGARSAAIDRPEWLVVHPRYPVLLPTLQAAIQDAADAGDDDRAVRPLHALFLPALLVILLDEASRAGGSRAAVAVTLLAAATPFLTVDVDGAGGTYADSALAAFWGGAVLLLSGPTGARPSDLLAAALLAAAVLTKREGAALVAVFLMGWLLTTRPAWTRALRVLGPPIAAAAFLAMWRLPIADRLFDDYSASAVSSGRAIASAAITIARVASAESLRPDRWGWLLPAAAVVLACGAARGRSSRRVRLLLLALGGLAALFVAAYLTTALPVDRLVRTTWSRVLLVGALPGLVLWAAALRASGGTARAVR